MFLLLHQLADRRLTKPRHKCKEIFSSDAHYLTHTAHASGCFYHLLHFGLSFLSTKIKPGDSCTPEYLLIKLKVK